MRHTVELRARPPFWSAFAAAGCDRRPFSPLPASTAQPFGLGYFSSCFSRYFQVTILCVCACAGTWTLCPAWISSTQPSGLQIFQVLRLSSILFERPISGVCACSVFLTSPRPVRCANVSSTLLLEKKKISAADRPKREAIGDTTARERGRTDDRRTAPWGGAHL